MDTTDHLLTAYDEQLRTDADTAGALSVGRVGPLHLAVIAHGRGFVTYPKPRSVGTDLSELVTSALEYFHAAAGISRIEWKTRDHDQIPGLHEALLEAGFVSGTPESIMIGDLRSLATEIELPDGVSLRQVTDESDVRAMAALQDRVFGEPVSDTTAEGMLAHLAEADGLELWVAESEGQMIGTGRLEPVVGTAFAGIWGGVVDPGWRGRGIYRALTSQRARSALAMGKTLMYSDSTEYSRPILERSGLVKVSTTTPYLWHQRDDGGALS